MNNPELIKTLKRLGWVAGLFLTLVLIVSAIERKSGSEVEQLEIVINPLPGGYRLIDTSDVRELIRRSFGFDLEGQKKNVVNINRLERVLTDDAFVLDAEVHINSQSEVKIEVWQREPVLRVIDNNGLNYYLDKEGIKLPLSKHFTARVLVATGDLPPHSTDFLEKETHLLKDLFQLAHQIRGDEFYRSLVEQVHTNSGEFTLIPNVGDQKIRFGTIEGAEEKLERLTIFYENGMPYEGYSRYKSLDLRYEGQVVAQKR